MSNLILQAAGFFSRDRVKAVAARFAMPSAEQVRRFTVSAIKKGSKGRGGLPGFAIELMYQDYLRLGSTREVGKIYGRSRQCIWELFKSHGLKMNDRNFHPAIVFGGRKWTPTKDGYYRPTSGDRREMLHHAIYKAKTGRDIPAGWQVSFRDGDNSNIAAENLFCDRIEQVTLAHYRRRFPTRAKLSAAELEEFWRIHNREYMRRKTKANTARGLRSDGLPRKRKVTVRP